ncbi:MAG: NfeD family protein [Bacteroidales bacterium]|nr:NfeD family protein [Bacteroidales bacterium]
MSLPIIIIVILAGLALVALEIVALPGAISGICGGILIITGVWQCYAQYGYVAGNITLLSSIVVGVIMLVWLMRSGTWKRFSLKEESDGKTNEIDNNAVTVGCRGKCISRLAPAGKALIGNEIMEVHSAGEYIDEGTEIEVIEIEGYKITVKKADN